MTKKQFAQVLVLGSALFTAINTKISYADPSLEPVFIGSRRELFIDHYLIDRLDDVHLELHEPKDEGVVLRFDKPWEGAFSGYVSVVKEGETFRLYYRGMPTVDSIRRDEGAVTCYAESKDGIHWEKPNLGLFKVQGTIENNVVLSDDSDVSNNFTPFIDKHPDVAADQYYKALGGTAKSGLIGYASADGIHWKILQNNPVFEDSYYWVFDSQNVAFWSATEEQYVLYYRKVKNKRRTIARTTSKDFTHWSKPTLMSYSDTGTTRPSHQFYTNQTHPYFRAPHIYVAIAARFIEGRSVLTDSQAKAIKVDPIFSKDTSDAVLMTTRGDNQYDHSFPEAFIRRGLHPQDWTSRSNFPALNVVQTGPNEMSVYVQKDYAQPTSHLRRYSMRLDGFASVQASHKKGEMVTKPFTFQGNRLLLNFATSAAGSIRVEIQDSTGQPFPGYTLADSKEIIGNEIEQVVLWQHGDDVSQLTGETIRLRFVMKEADLYALRFYQKPGSTPKKASVKIKQKEKQIQHKSRAAEPYKDPQIKKLETRLLSATRQRDKLLLKYTDKHPDVMTLNENIHSILVEIEQLKKNGL